MNFSEENWKDWLRRNGKKAGRRILTIGFELYYTYREESTPFWAKGVAVGALAYILSPIDAMIDPVFIDDISVATTALISIGRYVTPEISAKARKRVDEILGPDGGNSAGMAVTK